MDLQETYCTPADKLVIPNFSLAGSVESNPGLDLSPAGSVLSRKHGLATFAHERLEWSLVH